MLNTVDALAVQLFQKREGASNRLDGGSGLMCVLLNMLFSSLSRRFSRSIQWNEASSHWMPAMGDDGIKNLLFPARAMAEMRFSQS